MTADSLSPLLQKRMDEACDRFETAWKAGERPAIEDYLVGASEPERSVLLRELLKLEIELRCNDGASPLLDEYRQRFADEEELIRAVFAYQVRRLRPVRTIVRTWMRPPNRPPTHRRPFLTGSVVTRSAENLVAGHLARCTWRVTI